MFDNNKQATILLLIGTMFWGMTFVFIKEGVSIINVYSFLSYRFIIAGVLLGLIFFHKFKHFNFQLLKYGLILAIPLGISFITQTIGLQYTTASKGGFITGLSVVFVPIFLTCIYKKIPRWNHILSVIIATAGLAILTISNSFGINVGDIWIFICAVFFAIYIIMVGKITKHFDSILLTFVQLISIGIVTGIISLFLGELTIPKGYLVWQAIIFTSIFATAFMYAIQNHFQKFISEVKAAIIFSFEPLFAAVTAFFYLHEQLTINIIIGGLLIFIGMIISELKINNVHST
jgi:drug/metabolite transporter (DMT)-like permease